jgi:hypothetical protein
VSFRRVSPKRDWRPAEASLVQDGRVTAEATGRLASLLRFGLYAHAAALDLARDPVATSALLEVTDRMEPPSGFVVANDGSMRNYDLAHVIGLLQSDPELRSEMDRSWCVSSLILLGDRLAVEGYFDRAPILEMVRHLRNGIAHGNRFTIRNAVELQAWPAHTRDAACQGSRHFEVTPELDGTPVLFDYMGVGDVLDLLISASTHLTSLQRAEPRA